MHLYIVFRFVSGVGVVELFDIPMTNNLYLSSWLVDGNDAVFMFVLCYVA